MHKLTNRWHLCLKLCFVYISDPADCLWLDESADLQTGHHLVFEFWTTAWLLNNGPPVINKFVLKQVSFKFLHFLEKKIKKERQKELSLTL